MPASVVLTHIVKTFGGRAVLDRVSLEISRGEFFSILGPSGAGKTTLLRLCAGFDHPDSGGLHIDGRSMVGVPPNARPVNTVFQSYALFPHLTVEGNVGFGLAMRGIPREERDRRVNESLAMLKLEPLRTRVPSQLSGGEQQRVAIARALVNHPAVVLLDEPMASLDEPLRQAMLAELKAIQRQVGTTFVCVTHHQEEALAVSDRVAVMRAGRIVQIGTPRDVYEFPQTRFVAEFLGSANLLTGHLVEAREGELALAVDGLPSVVHVADPRSDQRPGSAAVLAVRTECLRLTQRRPDYSRWNVLAARVVSARYAGAWWHYAVALPGQPPWQVICANDGAQTEGFAPGMDVYVAWPYGEGRLVQGASE